MAPRVEICVEGPDGAAAAARGGADRVELCAALEVGGVTPSRGAVVGTRRAFPGELTVLVRPRPGAFTVTAAELDAMERDVEDALEAGADGVTVGVLAPDGTVDEGAVRRLVARADGRPVTFHRAIDVCADPLVALEVLVALGVARVLSSGGAATAAAGSIVLRAMVERAAGRIVVQAGGGVRAENVRALLAATGVPAVHASAAVPLHALEFPFGRAFETDADAVAALVRAVRSAG